MKWMLWFREVKYWKHFDWGIQLVTKYPLFSLLMYLFFPFMLLYFHSSLSLFTPQRTNLYWSLFFRESGSFNPTSLWPCSWFCPFFQCSFHMPPFSTCPQHQILSQSHCSALCPCSATYSSDLERITYASCHFCHLRKGKYCAYLIRALWKLKELYKESVWQQPCDDQFISDSIFLSLKNVYENLFNLIRLWILSEKVHSK